jgi:hypothetical protein
VKKWRQTVKQSRLGSIDPLQPTRAAEVEFGGFFRFDQIHQEYQYRPGIRRFDKYDEISPVLYGRRNTDRPCNLWPEPNGRTIGLEEYLLFIGFEQSREP